jgi:DNA-binding transcriptional LysR family regulator
MELRHLRYFVAVAEELNYRKASERLRVAQPALSSQIQDLEYELGVRLLDRDTGGVRLTDAGAAFLAESRLILAHAQQAVAVAREAAKGRRGRLTVGFVAPLLMGFMTASLKAFHEQYPEVEVTLVEMPIPEQITALRTGAIQIGFTIEGYAPFPKQLDHVIVARSPIRAVVGRGHRLARATRIALADLVHEPVLSFSVKKGIVVHGELIRRNFAIRGLKPGPIRAIEGAETFRTMLESGLGVSLIPEIGSLSRSPDLLFKPLKDTGEDLVLKLHALWRGGQNSPLISNFIATIGRDKPPGRRGNKAG